MRILYGVVGEGMGHATRSRVVIEHLLDQGHEIDVVVSGRAHDFLLRRLAEKPGVRVHSIHGLHLKYDGNAMELGRSILSNLGQAPAGIADNIAAYRELRRSLRQDGGGEPRVVISDFESWAFFYGMNHLLPVISIDNMQIINRCTHGIDITSDPDFQLAKAAVKVKLPGAYHYIVTTFFYPALRKERTTLVPPILRPEILAATREPREHVLVYQTAAANEALVPMLRTLPQRFVVYGMGKEGEEGNVALRAFSEAGFVEDLRTARAVLAGGGFSLMSECVHLRIPLYAVPIDGQYEQELNARYLEMLGYGAWARRFERDAVAQWLRSAPVETRYEPRGLDELHGVLGALLGQA
jgi:uncharacterized protein (TIGR00661 family)